MTCICRLDWDLQNVDLRAREEENGLWIVECFRLRPTLSPLTRVPRLCGGITNQKPKTKRLWEALLWSPGGILAGCLLSALGLMSFLNNARLISAARRWKLRCQKWIGHGFVVRRCSYTPATEPVLKRIHYARSVISRSDAVLHRHYGILFNQDMEPEGEIFLENHPGKIFHWARRESLYFGIRNALVRPWRTTVGPLGDALGDDHEGEGGSEEKVSVAGDREAEGSVTLTKEEKQRWKNRSYLGPNWWIKRSPSA